jgi:hypothetical protein
MFSPLERQGQTEKYTFRILCGKVGGKGSNGRLGANVKVIMDGI